MGYCCRHFCCGKPDILDKEGALTMKEFIEREDVLRQLRNSKKDNPTSGFAWKMACDCAISIVKEAPAADAVERKRGEWVMTIYTTTSKRGRVISNQKFACSECGYSNGRKKNANFCPNCGSDMRGEINDHP